MMICCSGFSLSLSNLGQFWHQGSVPYHCYFYSVRLRHAVDIYVFGSVDYGYSGWCTVLEHASCC